MRFIYLYIYLFITCISECKLDLFRPINLFILYMYFSYSIPVILVCKLCYYSNSCILA